MTRVEIMVWEKISLVVPEKEDIKLWYKWINNLSTQRYLWTSYWNIYFLEDEEDYFEIIRKNKDLKTFGIYIKNKKINIWNISLQRIDLQNRKADLWIVIFDKNFRWNGYWTESIKLILEYWFKVIWLNKINLKVLSNNDIAIKVYEKIWYKRSWLLKEENFRNWKFEDDVCMEIFASDFNN